MTQPIALSGFYPAPSERTPPHNLEAEQALLGALFLNNKAYERISEILSSSHFYEPLHASIFEEIAAIIQSGRTASPITLKAAFDHAPPISKDLSVVQYLGRLVAVGAATSAVKDYATTLRELAFRRDLMVIGDDLCADAAVSGAELIADELIASVEAKLFAMAEQGSAKGGTVSFSEAAHTAVDRIEKAYKRGGVLQGVSTGFIDLDNKLGGLQRSDLIILAGRPSMGKTALATNIAWNVAKGKLVDDDGVERVSPVGFFSLEMSSEQLAKRLISSEASIDSHKLNRGGLTPQEMEAVVRKARELSRTPLYIDDRGGISIAQLTARARRMKRQHGIELLVVDYLQLLSGSKKERVQEITQITTGLKSLAKELDIPIIALSQLSRANEKREDKRPQLSDLRESGSIEQDADVVMFVYREEYYVEREKPSDTDLSAMADWSERMDRAHGKAEAIVGKQRHGPIGIVELSFEGHLTRFGNLARSDAAMSAREGPK